MINEFLSYLTAERRDSPHTIEAYGRDLRQFADWLRPLTEQRRRVDMSMPLHSDSTGEPDWTLVSTADVREWIGTLADEGMQPTTLRRKTQSLRAFYRWGLRRGTFSRNPAAEIPLVKKKRQLPNFVKEKEMEQLLTAPTATADGEDDFKTTRTHIALLLLYSLGLRQAELLLLTDADLSADRRELRVTGKRNKQRVVPVPEALGDEIARWQNVRDQHLPDLETPRPLMAGKQGRVSKEMLYRIVREGLDGVSAGRKSPHTLRHTFATAMLNHGADIDAVREMLGHASLQTTQIYTHVSYKELIANYRRAHPRAPKGGRHN